MRRILLLAPLALGLAACDAPTVPPLGDVYPFALESTPPVVFHWPLGSTVRVYLDEGGDAARDPVLGAALERTVGAWNQAAVFGEFRLERTSALREADVVVAWSDAPLPVQSPDPERCGISGGRAVTIFCPDPAMERLLVFPLVEGGGGRVRMVVTLYPAEAADGGRLAALLTHEVGHVLGLFRHPDPQEFPGSVMLSDPGSVLPAASDLATIRELYRTPSDLRL